MDLMPAVGAESSDVLMRSPAIVDRLQGAVSAYGGKAPIQPAQEFRVFALAHRDRQRRLVDLCPRQRHLTRIESGSDDCASLVIKRCRVCLACDEASQTLLVAGRYDQFYFRGSSLNNCRERTCPRGNNNLSGQRGEVLGG